MSPIARTFLIFSSVPMRASFLPISAMPAFPTRITASRKGNGEYPSVRFARAEFLRGIQPLSFTHYSIRQGLATPPGKKFGFDDFFFSLICTATADILYISTLCQAGAACGMLDDFQSP